MKAHDIRRARERGNVIRLIFGDGEPALRLRLFDAPRARSAYSQVRKTVYLCDGSECGTARCRELASFVTALLNVGFNQRSEDGVVRVKPMRCRGREEVPASMMLNEECVEVCDLDEAEQLLRGWLACAES